MQRRVRTLWTDLNGLTHGRYIPSARFDHATHHAVTTLAMSPEGEILPIAGYSADVGFPDLSAVPLATTRRPGLGAGHRRGRSASCSTATARPLALCPRGALERAVGGWRSLGFEPQLGFELELYLLERDEAAVGGWRPAGGDGHRVYGVGLGGDPTGLALEFFDAIETMEIDLEGVLTEFSPGQMEINLTYGPALAAADAAQLVKEMTREVAARRGYKTTYLGRPDAMSVGSGLHVNFSLVPISGGANAFHDPSGLDGLSTIARQSIGGLIAHHEALAGLSAPLINSYKRLMPGLIAGYWANWGLDNRFSTYRVPAERGPATRIENRMPCGDRQPVPGGGGDAERRPARRRRRHRLRRPADRRCRRRAEHRPPHAAHAPRGARRGGGGHRADRGDGSRPRRRLPRPAPPRGRPLGGEPGRAGIRRRSPPGSSTATCPSTD